MRTSIALRNEPELTLKQRQPSVVYVRNATENGTFVCLILFSYQYAEPLAKAPYATHTSAQKRSCGSATSVILALTVDAVSSADLQVRCFVHEEIYILTCRKGISDAYYCAECTRLEKDRDGCPKIVNLGASRTDLFYERRRLGESSLSFFPRLSLCVLTALRLRL